MKRYAIGLIVSTLGSGCGLLLGADDVQCNEDSDCTDRGFADAACVENVCVAAGIGHSADVDGEYRPEHGRRTLVVFDGRGCVVVFGIWDRRRSLGLYRPGRVGRGGRGRPRDARSSLHQRSVPGLRGR